MTKSIDAMSEAIRNPKYPFRQVDAQPDKAHKHRYERRKVKEFMRFGDWASEVESRIGAQ